MTQKESKHVALK